jgi:hypothetical protein
MPLNNNKAQYKIAPQVDHFNISGRKDKKKLNGKSAFGYLAGNFKSVPT